MCAEPSRFGGSALITGFFLKTIRQLVTFLLGVSVGVCLYSLLRFRPLPLILNVLSPKQAFNNRPKQVVTRPEVKVPAPAATTATPSPAVPKRIEVEEASVIPLPSWPQPQIAEPLGFVRPKKPTKIDPKPAVASVEAPKVAEQPVVEQPKKKAPVSRETQVATLAMPMDLQPVDKAPVERPPVERQLVGSRSVSQPPQQVQVKSQPQAAQVEPPPPVQVEPPPPARSQPQPTNFKALGYVEKSDGQLEAVIMQENEIQVVHVGDRIADRYRVTKITPETVAAVDETILQIPILKSGEARDHSVEVPQLAEAETASKPSDPKVSTVRPQEQTVAGSTPPRKKNGSGPPINTFTPLAKASEDDLNSLGYVQKSDGKVESIVADGDSVRLVPSTEAGAMAMSVGRQQQPQVADDSTVARPSKPTVARAVIASQPADNSSLKSNATAFRHGAEQSQNFAASALAATNCSACETSVAPKADANVAVEAQRNDEATPLERGGMGMRRDQVHSSKSSATYIFQTLGFVESKNGEVQAIVADGADTYLVKAGQVFAKQYQAVSVDSLLVVAVRKPVARPLPDFLSARTDFSGKAASNKMVESSSARALSGKGILPLGGLVQAGSAGSNSVLGINLFNHLTTEFSMHSFAYTTDTN